MGFIKELRRVQRARAPNPLMSGPEDPELNYLAFRPTLAVAWSKRDLLLRLSENSDNTQRPMMMQLVSARETTVLRGGGTSGR